MVISRELIYNGVMNKEQATKLTKDEVFTEIEKEIGKRINEPSLYARVRKKRETGELVRVGKGIYSPSHLPVFDYAFFSPTAKEIHSFLMKEYGGKIYFAVYEAGILNRFLNHLIAVNTVIVDVEKEFAEAVFFALKENGFQNVLLNPTEEDCVRYCGEDGKSIIVKTMPLRSPVNRKNGKVMLEKLLVDVVSDKRLRYFFEGDETEGAIEEMVTHYSLDYAKARTYAKRRNCFMELFSLLPEETRRKYL